MLQRDAAFSLANVLEAGAILSPSTPQVMDFTWGKLCACWVSSLFAALPRHRDALDGAPDLAPGATCSLVPRQGCQRDNVLVLCLLSCTLRPWAGLC